MKLLASRTDRDIDDIKILYNLCGRSTAEEGIEVLESYYLTGNSGPRPSFSFRNSFPSNIQEIETQDWALITTSWES